MVILNVSRITRYSYTKSFIINMHYIMHIFPHLVALFVELSLRQSYPYFGTKDCSSFIASTQSHHIIDS
jgi:hypothetical protein